MFNVVFVSLGMAVFAMMWGALNHEGTELTVARVVFSVVMGLAINAARHWYVSRRDRRQK